MKYYGTYACGHEGAVDIYGPSKDREWKKENAFSRLCPECREKARQQERDIANKKAAEAAAEMGLPKLTGTEKQVAWVTPLAGVWVEIPPGDTALDCSGTPDVKTHRKSAAG